MTKKARILIALFVLVAVIHVIAVAMQISFWQTATKPLIIPVLSGIYLTTSKIRNKWYLTALLFSWLGDILLMDKDNLFLFGVASFLITQILYLKMFSGGIRKTRVILMIFALIPFLVYYWLLIAILDPGLGPYRLPVLIYGMVISLFGSVSLLQYLKFRDARRLILLSGAVLFILSDSMIALNKFHQMKVYYPVAIMVTYILSQYLIMRYVLQSEQTP